MSQKFEPGEIVNIHIDGAWYVGGDDGHRQFSVPNPDGEPFELWLARGTTARVERVAPKQWPPQIGDLWADAEGDEWFAHFNSIDSDEVAMVLARDGGVLTSNELLASFGPLRLVRRRGWAPDAPPAEPTPAEVDKRAEKVAGLRAFADLLEGRPDVPLPYGINGQVGFRGEEGLAEALRLAASLGVELDAGHDTGHEVQRWARSVKLDLGADVTLTLYAYGLDAPPAPPVDCCPDAEPDDPAAVGGETVEDAEAES